MFSMSYFLCSNCPLSLGTSGSRSGTFTGNRDLLPLFACSSESAFCICILTIPISRHWLSSRKKRKAANGRTSLHLHTFLLISQVLVCHPTPHAQRINNEKGGKNNSLAAVRRHADPSQMVFLKNMCRVFFSFAIGVTVLQ